MRAAVGRYAPIPGTRSFIRAAVASCGCFPGTRSFYAPPLVAALSSPAPPPRNVPIQRMGKELASEERAGQFLGRAAAGADKTIGRC
ncbi:hypothetical protein MNBD_ALPHA12-903 [hydrothermal vent metagenome]|uniref:Uncharacterized protein n=1 Tax=hydrothermal vent metagenome TaxID=652676 RepID=A0A3B0TYN0_9ZZZZ